MPANSYLLHANRILLLIASFESDGKNKRFSLFPGANAPMLVSISYETAADI